MSLIDKRYCGIFNVTGPEYISKYEFGVRLAEIFSLNKELICPLSIKEFKFDAVRPFGLNLNTEKLKRAGVITRTFKEDLHSFYRDSLTWGINI